MSTSETTKQPMDPVVQQFIEQRDQQAQAKPNPLQRPSQPKEHPKHDTEETQ